MTNTICVTRNNAVKEQTKSYQPTAIASDSRFAASTPYVKRLTKPKFSRDQVVCFVGGVGTIRSCQPNSGTWTYVVEMELGPEPDMGRVGNETKILLLEPDIREVTK